jgi:hypothetical protein
VETLKVLFDETRFIDFLIKNSPKVTEILEPPISPKANTSKNEGKSPEQSSRVQEDLKISDEKPKKVLMPSSQNMCALQAHVKILS